MSPSSFGPINPIGLVNPSDWWINRCPSKLVQLLSIRLIHWFCLINSSLSELSQLLSIRLIHWFCLINSSLLELSCFPCSIHPIHDRFGHCLKFNCAHPNSFGFMIKFIVPNWSIVRLRQFESNQIKTNWIQSNRYPFNHFVSHLIDFVVQGLYSHSQNHWDYIPHFCLFALSRWYAALSPNLIQINRRMVHLVLIV